MDKSNFILDTTLNSKILQAVDLVNKTTDTSKGISKSRLLLITLSTTVMMAKKEVLPKEYFQWTRAYLETVKNEDGTSLRNMSKFLKYIDKYEKEHNITDELQNTLEELPSGEKIEFIIQEPDEDDFPRPDVSMLSSTKNPNSDQLLQVPQENLSEAIPNNQSGKNNANSSRKSSDLGLKNLFK